MRVDIPNVSRYPSQLGTWINDVSDLLNQGGYQISASSIPTSDTGGQPGESRIAKDGSTWYLYIYTDSTDGWKRIAMSALS